MSAIDPLVAALGRAREARDWSARAREVVRVERVVDGPARTITRTELAARVHVDAPTGRGSADLVVAAARPLPLLIDEAIGRAAASIGPGWRAPPPGAPARVTIADPSLGDPDEASRLALAALARAARTASADLADGVVAVEIATVAVATASGLSVQWTETLVDVTATIAVDGVTATARRRARSARALLLDARVAAAASRARGRPAAIATPTGRRDVVMPAEVLGGDAGGVLAVLATLADASLHRQGLARTRVGAAVVEGADVAPEPLTVRCDGTQRLGLGSAPLGDHGEPVRRFTIVDGGVLRGLALDEREAALRGEPPNGGVRNLTIGGGASTPEALRAPGALELLEVTHVDVEPLTGQVAIGIGLATLHGDAGATTTVSGGELQGDLVAALCRSRRTAGTSRDGGYIGPGLIGLPGLIVV